MFFENGQTTEQMSRLFTEAKQYWTLQKQHLSLQTTEVLTRLLSAIALWAIVILIGSLVLLFASFAIAFWLGGLLGNTVWGFVIIAAVLLVVTLLVYANRTAWIIVPVTRFMVSLFVSSLASPTREGVAMEKVRVQEKLDESQLQMRETASTLLSPLPEAKNRWDRATGLFQNGMSIYRGLQLGLSAIAAFRAIFGRGKRRRR